MERAGVGLQGAYLVVPLIAAADSFPDHLGQSPGSHRGRSLAGLECPLVCFAYHDSAG